MLFSPQYRATYLWRFLKRSFFNKFISFDDGMFSSCLISVSAQFSAHYYQWPGKKCKTSRQKLFGSVIMESEADENHHKTPQRKNAETLQQHSVIQDLHKKANEDVEKIYLPPSLQNSGISDKDLVNVTDQMPLQNPDKKSIEDRSAVKQLATSMRYKCVPENDLRTVKSWMPQQERTDICDFKHNDFHTSLDSRCSRENECNVTSKQQTIHAAKADKSKLQLPPSLLNFVEEFVRDNIKVVTDQIKKDSFRDSQRTEFSGSSPCKEFEDTEAPFSNMDLFSSSDSIENSEVVQKKKSRKQLKKFSKKKILIALAVAILAFIISSLSRSEWYEEKMGAKSRNRKESGSHSVQSESDGTPDGKGKKKKPNYFIAIQVNSTEITKAAMKIQSGIQEASGQDLSQLKIAPETLHITLMVMHFSTLEEIDRASHCLVRCVSAIKKMQRDLPMTVEFEGLSGFSGGRVIFACIKAPGEETLQFLSDEVKKQMKECGIEDTDPESKPFRPHLTLMKYKWKSKSKSTKGPKKVEDSWYQAFALEYLGSQKINSLQLCKMDGKRDDGYYFVAQEVPL